MAKIDPGHTVFRGAEGTGEAQLLGSPSTFDPVQFMERNRYTDMYMRGQQNKQKAESIEKGLKDLDIKDLKKWQDEEGYNDIMKRRSDLEQAYIYLSSPYGKGLNLTTPQTEEDIQAYKMIKEGMTDLQGRADVYMKRGEVSDNLDEIVRKDKEGRVDQDYVREQLGLAMSEKDPRKSLEILQGAMRYKPEDVDWIKWASDNVGDYVQLDKNFSFGVNEDTGRVTTKTWENYNMAKVKKGLGRMYDNMNQDQKKQWGEKHKADKGIYDDGMSPKEYFVHAFTPEQVKKRTGTQGGKLDTGVGSSGWPQKDASGAYTEVPETLTYASETTGEPAEYVSPYTFSLSPLFKTAKDDVALTTGTNTRLADTNEQLGKAGQSYMSKGQRIVLLPVADQDIEMGYEVGAMTVKKGQRLTAEQVDYMNNMSMEQKARYSYTYEPYYDDLTYIKQRMAGGGEGPFEDDASPVSYNESSYRPYFGQVQNTLKSKFGDELDKSIMEIYNQLKKDRFEGILGGAPQTPHM